MTVRRLASSLQSREPTPPRRAAGDTTSQGATGGPRGGSAPTPRVARRLGKIVTADAQQPPPPPTKFTAISEWAAAKQSSGRRFHALYDRSCRDDVLREAWERVLENRGAAGVDRVTLVAVEDYGVDRAEGVDWPGADELSAATRTNVRAARR